MVDSKKVTYHWLDIGMWYRVKLVVFKFEFRSDIDVSSFVFCGITILGCREDYIWLVSVNVGSRRNIPVMHLPLCSTS